MTSETEATMAQEYEAALRKAESDLAGLGQLRRKLEVAIASLRSLVGEDQHAEQEPLALDMPLVNGSKGLPSIPPGLFRGKTQTQAYRELMKLWPGDYKGAQIADMLTAGGLKAESRSKLIAGIHSVLKRERERQRRDEEVLPEGQ